jgi:hypothetical protein
MDAPPFFYSMGGISTAIGIIFILLRKPISLMFCNFGKWSMKMNPFFDQAVVDSLYDEKKFLKILPVLGIVLIIQGIVMLMIGYFTSGN